jgi:hypothetical protein
MNLRVIIHPPIPARIEILRDPPHSKHRDLDYRTKQSLRRRDWWSRRKKEIQRDDRA